MSSTASPARHVYDLVDGDVVDDSVVHDIFPSGVAPGCYVVVLSRDGRLSRSCLPGERHI